MDSSHQQPRNDSPSLASPALQSASKRPYTGADESPAKRARPAVEVPAVYSDAVRKKLAATSRTGQACDRCKERKMKCDTNPIACQPCRQKSLRCFTTDRVTGQSRERGQTDRAESELQTLREQNAAYRRRYGPIESIEYQTSPYTPAPDQNNDRMQYHPQSPLPPPPIERDRLEKGVATNLPDTKFIGWPGPPQVEPLFNGPVNGTQVDVLDGIVDVADFPCSIMDEHPVNNLNVFNMSRASIINTLTGYQNITDPRFPSKEQAIQDANTFIVIMSQYVPIVHRPSFMSMIGRIYDHPNTVSLSERVQLAVVIAIVEHQMALRNHKEAAEKFELSHYHFHYALTYHRELLRERTLASMQALALMLVHFRNLPKPGYSWEFAHSVLVLAMNAEYHRDPDKIRLPPEENNILAKELRKRIFHSILGICVATGSRIGRPIPWQYHHMDVPLPMAIKDTEISEDGLASQLSGSCDFWPCLQLAKLLPLYTDMYTYVTSVRRSEREYVKTVEILHSKVDAWRRDWDESIRREEKQPNLHVASLLVDNWAAEYTLNLYHPSLCSSRSTEVMDRHLDICHKAAQRLLKNFHILSNKYKGVDFTWHSTISYALGFGVTLCLYQKRKARVTTAQFDSMKNEFKGWMSLMAYADLVLRTGNHLQHSFEPRVGRLESEYQDLMRGTPGEPSIHQPANIMSNATSSRPQIKPDPGSRPSPLNTSNGLEMRQNHNQPETPNLQYNQPHPGMTNQQWSHPVQYATQNGNGAASYMAHTGSGTPTYAAYSTSAPQYSPLPTSLAPLLNEHHPGNYMTYPPNNTSNQNEMMMFHPAHYTDGPATMMWPKITLPTQEQGQQHDSGGNMNYH